MTPADELTIAAAKLRNLATKATPGNWQPELLPPNEHHKHPAHWVTTEYDDDGGTNSVVVADCPWRQGDADYIATMGPTAGLALADWLDAESRRLTAVADPGCQEKVAPHPVAVARAINGGVA